MARKQTRRSVSVSREAYDALRAKCDADGVAMSAIVEAYVRKLCGLGPSLAVAGVVERRAGALAAAAVAEAACDTPRVPLPDRAALDRIAATRLRAKLDAAAERRRERAAEANPCRRNCGDGSWHAVGSCRPTRKPWTRRAIHTEGTP